MLRKFASYPRQNGLADALRELGRIERMLFIPDWLQNVELPHRVHAGLNKGEVRNALAPSCCGLRSTWTGRCGRNVMPARLSMTGCCNCRHWAGSTSI
jgi:hypothetical protein